MTYEYLCTACGHAWEAEQSISAAALKTCPNCQKDAAKRQVSGGAGFILKGGGWYADLYGSAKPKAADAKGDAKGDGSKTESAPVDTSSAAVAAKASEGSSGSSGSTGSGSSSGSSSGSKGTGTSSAA